MLEKAWLKSVLTSPDIVIKHQRLSSSLQQEHLEAHDFGFTASRFGLFILNGVTPVWQRMRENQKCQVDGCKWVWLITSCGGKNLLRFAWFTAPRGEDVSFVCSQQKEKIREKFVSTLKEEFKGKGLTFSIGKWTAVEAILIVCS